jgi:hypothetical protein
MGRQCLLRLCFPLLCLIPALSLAAAANAPGSPASAASTAPAVPEENFSGYWLWAEGNDRFTLTLTQDGTTLTGRHSSSLNGSKLIDSVEVNQPFSITGEVKGEGAVARFTSGATDTRGGSGHALLTLRGRYLYWHKMDETGGNHLPQDAILIRQNNPQ